MRPRAVFDVHAFGRRFLAGATQAELAAELGIHHSAMSKHLRRDGYQLSRVELGKRRQRPNSRRYDVLGCFDNSRRAQEIAEAERAWAILPSNAFQNARVPKMLGQIPLPETHVPTQSGIA